MILRPSLGGRHGIQRSALQIQLRNKADSTGHRDASRNANGGGGQFQKVVVFDFLYIVYIFIPILNRGLARYS